MLFSDGNPCRAARGPGDKKRGKRVRVGAAWRVSAPSPVAPQLNSGSAVPGLSSSGSLWGKTLWPFRALRSKNVQCPFKCRLRGTWSVLELDCISIIYKCALCFSVSLLAVVCLYLVNRAQGKQLSGFLLHLGWIVLRASAVVSVC